MELWERVPDVAAMMTANWPLGVFGPLEPPDPLPPHPKVLSVAIATRKPTPNIRKLRPLRFRTKGQKTSTNRAPESTGSSHVGRPLWKGVCRSVEAVGILVAIVNTKVAADPIGVTDAGLKLHDVNEGKPEQLREVGPLNALIGVMVMVDMVELPLVTVALVGKREIAKSGVAVTVTGTTFDIENALSVSPA